MNEIKRLGNIYRENEGGNFGGNTYDPSGLCPTINIMGGGNRQPIIIEKYIVASRGRNIENPSNRTPGIELEQRLEVREGGICGCITSVFKDNMVLERKRTEKNMDKVEVIKDGYAYRIRKITPKETFLLMGLTEKEFEDAQKVSSNSALYKAAGNGLVPNCIVAILGQLLLGREDYYQNVDNIVDNVDKIID
jgi:DNA (cytosine-5)-methyltransferase 1